MSPAPAAGSVSARFREQIAHVIGPYSDACTRLVEHPRVAELWPEYLVVQHQIIRATVPLTEAALRQARALPAGDPVAAPLAEYLIDHVGEEHDHDLALLADLELIGLRREEVLPRMPSPAVAALVGSQYYWLLHHHPVTLLGFVGVMEGYPPTPELIETLVTRTQLPRESFSTFLEHGELDPGHRDHLNETLDALPLTREHERAIGISALTTVGLATPVLEELLQRA